MAKKKYTRRAAGEPTIYEARRGGKQLAFLAALETGLSISSACSAAGLSPSTQRNWRELDPKFAADFRAAYAAGTGALAAEALRRAVEGVERPVFYQGRPVIDPTTGSQLVIREYSDTLLMFLLKSRDPETYCDRVRAEKILQRWRKRDDESSDKGAVPIGEVVELLSRLSAQKAATAEH